MSCKIPSRPARSKSATLAFTSIQVGEVFFGLAVTIVLQIVAARRYSRIRFSSNWYELSRLPNSGVASQSKGLPSIILPGGVCCFAMDPWILAPHEPQQHLMPVRLSAGDYSS